MSLNINFTYPIETFGDIDIQYVDIEDTWHENQVNTHLNITHNLGEMASHVKPGIFTLYDVLWRPYRMYNIEDDTEKSYRFRIKASELEEILEVCIEQLITDKKRLLKYEPDNGWGTYTGLLEFCKKYLRGIKRYPNAKIETSR